MINVSNSRGIEGAGQAPFSLDSVVSEEAGLVEHLAQALRSGPSPDDVTPFVSSGSGKKFQMAGNAGISRF